MSRPSDQTFATTCRIFFAACLFPLGLQAHAALTTYSSANRFSSALATQGTDQFADASFASTNSRTAGSFAYTVDAPSGFRSLQLDGLSYLGNAVGYEWMTFTPSSANAIGGMFFTADSVGGFKAGSVTLRVIDSLGDDATFVIAPAGTTDAFFGVSSTGTILSLRVHADQGWTPSYLSVGGVSIGSTSAVPEPDALTLMSFGLCVAGVAASRRAKRTHCA